MTEAPGAGNAVRGSQDLAAFVRDVPLPALTLLRSVGATPALADVEEATRKAMTGVLAGRASPPGPVAVAVGSRGMADLVAVVRVAVGELRRAGWSPFVVPAMGSHGGGTERGQVKVLEGLGITEQTVGAPVRATMAVEETGSVHGVRVVVDQATLQAGAVLLVNRVKAHTDFHGAVESGPAKMLALGLGHVVAAAELHADGPAGLRALIPEVARSIVSTGLVVGAIATVENEIGQTAIVQGLQPHEIAAEPEMRLLRRAKEIMPRLPFGELDVLVVQRLGKDLSGEGLDPNVIGRMYITGVSEPERPAIRCIAALSLTAASAGNALGVGLTDFISQRLAEAIDVEAMYANALTAGIVDVQRAKVPIVLPSDRLAIQAALASCGRRDLSGVRLMWIRDTEHLEVVGVSAALVAAATGRDDLKLLDAVEEMRFDGQGSLLPPVGS